jgi:hypothetical protein
MHRPSRAMAAAVWAASAMVAHSDEMLRAFDEAIDGPANSDEAKRYRIVQGERICGWSCDPSGPYYEEDKHLCPAECKPGYVAPAGKPGRPRNERLRDVCPQPPPPLEPVVGRASCSSDAAALTAAGTWMLIAVQTGPFNKGRRDGVRASWKRWEADTPGVLVCFLIGRVGVSEAVLSALDAEDAEHRDVLWLPNATDAGVPTIKGYHWWTTAARLLPPPGSKRGLRIVAKVDDDSFLHIGNLVADSTPLPVASLRGLSRAPCPGARLEHPIALPAQPVHTVRPSCRPSAPVTLRRAPSLRLARIHRVRPVDLAAVRLVVAAVGGQLPQGGMRETRRVPPLPLR